MPKKKGQRRNAYIVQDNDTISVNVEEFITSPQGIFCITIIAIVFTILTTPTLYTFLFSKIVSYTDAIFFTGMRMPIVGNGLDQNLSVASSTSQIVTERFKAFNKAIELSGQRDYKNALSWFETTNTIADGNLPTNDILNTEWGNTYYHMFKEALADGDTVEEENVDNSDINAEIVVNSKKHSNILQKAIMHYKIAMEINEHSFGAIGNLAEIYMRYAFDNGNKQMDKKNNIVYNNDKMKDVKHLLNKLIEIRNLCEPHRQIGKKTKAEVPTYCTDIKENKEEFTETIRKTFILKAELYFNEKKFLQSEAFLKQAVKIRQSNEVYEKFGIVYEKLKKFQLAYTYYMKCKQKSKFCRERCLFLDEIGKKALNQKGNFVKHSSSDKVLETKKVNVKNDEKEKPTKRKTKKVKKKKKRKRKQQGNN
jgi:tetratricopeptide (TPR) repeat protein